MTGKTATGWARRLVPCCVLLFQDVALAADPPASQGAGAALMRQSFADHIPDCLLRNQRGEMVRFFTELVKGRAVVINFFYADCEKSCPPTNVAIRRLRTGLAPSFGKSVHFVSITLRPEVDTVERLARYASVNAPAEDNPDLPDWDFLTGDPEDIRTLRRALGLFEAEPALDQDPSQHGSVLVVGNHSTGRWTKVNALGNPERTRAQVKRMIGWSEAQRYEDVRKAVEVYRNARVEAVNSPDSGAGEFPGYGKLVGSLSGVNAAGDRLDTASLAGKVVVFGRLDTTCPHGLQAIARVLDRLNLQFGHFERFHLVTLATPSPATGVEYLSEIAKYAGAEASDPWWFLATDPIALSRFAQQSLGLDPSLVVPEEERLSPFEAEVHDLRLVLVDATNTIRGRYEVFHADPARGLATAEQLEADIRKLLLDAPSQ